MLPAFFRFLRVSCIQSNKRMSDHQYREGREEMLELLNQYESMKAGRRHNFLEEDDFERIIDHFDDGDHLEKALEAAELGSEQFPYSSMLLVKKADLQIAAGKYKEALLTLDGVEMLDGGEVNIVVLRTDAYLALEQHDKAVELLQEALQRFDGEERIDLLFSLSDVYDDYEEFDKVFDCLQMILEDEPTNQEALYKICFWTDMTGRNEESIAIHKKIIDQHPYNELGWFNLAAAYQGLKLYEKAIDAYQFAITIDETFDFAYRNMADAYIRIRKYRDAIEALEKVLELARPEDVIYEAIGFCYHKMKNFAQARLHYRKASHLNQTDSKLIYKIATTYMDEEQWVSAIKQLEAAMRMHRLQPDYNLAMGECLMQLKKYKEAITFFGNVIISKPKNVSGWESFIRCLYKAGMPQEAFEQTEMAMQQTGDKAIFHFYAAACLFALGKTKAALMELENGMDLSPKHLKQLIALNPTVLQNAQVVDIIARYKKSKKM
jgi:tetratricopeptide (TPR) repeat protein